MRLHLSMLCACAALLPSLVRGQALPTATGPGPAPNLNLGLASGTFHYGVSASETFSTGYGPHGNSTEQTNLSGTLAYSTRSQTAPSSLIYSGGVLFSNGGGYGTTTFQSLTLSQGYQTRAWTFGATDVVSYLPQSPTVGLSGIPGVGDVGLTPVVGVNTPAQNILTYDSTRLSNTFTGDVSRRITARTSISGDGSYGLLHFFNDSLLNSHQISGDLGLNHEISARTSVGLGANYSIFTYPNYRFGLQPSHDASFTTRSLSVRAQHQFTRALSGSVSIGPQWVNSSSNLGIPSRVSVSAAAGLTYARHFGTFGAFYSRGVNGGSGVLPGGFSDTINGSFSRAYGHNWALSANAGYSRTSSLSNTATPALVGLPALGSYGNFDSVFAGGQVTRRISDSLSAYAGYTASKQTYGNVATTAGAINGLVQFFSIGISYYPRSVNLGQF